MRRDVLLPQVELTMESARIARWLVKVGDRVAAEQPILEVETQKATSDIPAPVAGFVRQLCVEAGQMVREKALLCIVTDTADELMDAAAPMDQSEVKASPAARRLARELAVDLAKLKGTGPGGRVSEEDVKAASAAVPETDSWTALPATRIALIAQMQKSLADIPQIQVRRRLDVSPLMAKAPGITFTHRLVKAAAAALGNHPALRTMIDGNRIKIEPVSVAVAMETPHGLVAPTVRNAAKLSLEDIAAAMTALRAKADANSLQRGDFIDAPFAITNLGMLGVDQFDAFVFHGQTAVLSVGRAAEDGGQMRAWFGLAADHRVVDGAEAARFLESLQAEVARP